jgi:biopolymer transport protein ExbB/TolQ
MNRSFVAIVLVGFGVLALGLVLFATLTIKTDLTVVNVHRDVSTLNQRFSGVTNLDERFEKQRKDNDAAFSQVLAAVREEGRVALEKVDERAKVLEAQVRAYDNRLRAVEAANADLRKQLEAVQQRRR